MLKFFGRFSALAVALALSVGGCAQPVEEGAVARSAVIGYSVQTNFFCRSLESITVAYETVVATGPLGAAPEGCGVVPAKVVAPILEVVAGPTPDWEGDIVYAVRVYEGLYTLAWPGINSDAPTLKSI